MFFINALPQQKKTEVYSKLRYSVFLFGAYIFDLLLMLIKGQRLLDSDMASEMILSNQLNNEHSILGITTTWFYSTELRFLETQWFYRIGLVLAPNNWHIARTIAVALMLFLLALSAWLLFRVCDRDDIALCAAAFSLCPCGSWYLWQTIYGSYYLPYICISIFTIVFVILASKSDSKIKRCIYTSIIVFLGISSGLNGVKQLMVFYAPFVIAMIALVAFRIRCFELDIKNGFNAKELYMLALALLATFASCLGYVINSKVMVKYYNFSQFNDNQIYGAGIIESLRYYIWSFGYNESVELMSFGGLAVMLGVIIGFLTIICAWRLLRNFRSLKLFEQVIVAISCSSIAFCVFIFSYVGGEMQYYQPILPFGLFLILIDIHNEKYVLKNSKEVILAIFCAMLVITSLGTTLSEFRDPLHPDRSRKHIREVVSFLVDSGYDKGVSFFWDSNIITELSDGKIEMWTLEIEDSKYQVHPWLQKKNHLYNFPSAHYFFVVESDMNIDTYLDTHPDLELIYRDDYYNVWGN